MAAKKIAAIIFYANVVQTSVIQVTMRVQPIFVLQIQNFTSNYHW